MCEYCNKMKSIFWYETEKTNSELKEVYIEPDESMTVDFLYNDAISIKINYCPMCGRKLGETIKTKEYYFYHDTKMECVGNMVNDLTNMMTEEWENGGAYVGDRLKVTINVEYEPEDK